ncbi:MAG: DUF3662 and FHA domain-containing protein [Microbacteriaceae bacterium]|nr:DUF3662 and FHA domain-containing protein [Microbacteriaceae bacterium]
MGLLSSIERGLERAVNGAFARTFRSGVQPLEITAALRREIDSRAVMLDRDRTLAPNIFIVQLASADYERLNHLGATLTDELEQLMREHAREHEYTLLGPISVQLREKPGAATGTVEVTSQKPDANTRWQAVLEIEGRRHPLQHGANMIGRGGASTIHIGDNAASRQHLEIIWDGSRALARDLNSTNGSKINGQRFREAALQDGSVIYIGQTPLKFKLVPADNSAAAAAPQRASQQYAAPRQTHNQPQPAQAQPQQSGTPSFWEGV